MKDLSDITAIESGLSALHRVAFQHQAWESIQRRAGISMDRANVALLKVVASHENTPCRLQAVARHLGIEAPSVTRTVQELEQAGLLVRQADPTDGRASNVSLTSKGERQLAKLQAARQQHLAESLQHWSSADLRTLGALLERFAEDLSQHKTT